MPIALNPTLDAFALRDAYRRRNRVQIRDFLDPASATAMREELEQIPWGLVFRDGPRVVELYAPAVQRLDQREATAIMAKIREQARTGYQFFYANYPLLTAYFSPEVQRRRIFDLYEFINSPPVLNLVREVTGLPGIAWADAQTTYFKPGHFLKAHTDEAAAEGRLAAYVMNFTENWDHDGGGFLQFFDSQGDIDQAIKPAFNALNIFTVPQLHSVSMVSTWVTAKRLSMTGWFRSDSPPGPIGNRR
ncbi:MAG: 2OG-Fe(II) oxygenase [Pseudomonadota bacterium]|nr:2OG-Fe(II) oxygenase [Pseudomonadota bacterium]